MLTLKHRSDATRKHIEAHPCEKVSITLVFAALSHAAIRTSESGLSIETQVQSGGLGQPSLDERPMRTSDRKRLQCLVEVLDGS
jgi:hypothetical protein